MSLALTPDQPWLGLASYEETHRPYFFGRRAEEEDLFERVRRHRLTVLYGPSGLGKTSLLRAGLMPRLVTAGWLPVRVRLTYPERLDTIVEADPQSLLHQVLESLAAALAAAEHSAGEKLRAALSAPLASSVTPLPSLWELWHDTAWGLREPGAPRPVLLLDQFEEIFTLGEDEARARSAARVLRDALADLIEDRPPPALDRRLHEDTALAERFDFTPDTARVVLVLREDYLSRLERWKKLLPSLLRNRLELRLLDGPSAMEAVTGPARAGQAAGDAGLVPDAVAAAIIRAVADVPEETPVEDIEAVPPLLSLLCKELNEKRRTASPAAAQIDLALVRENRSAILQRFYEECFDGFPPAVRLVIEDHLLSPGGYRENPGYDTLVSALTARGVPEPVRVLTALVERRLITAEDRGGRRRVELTHDVLAPIVKRSLDERREREAAEEAQRKLADESAKARRRRVLVSVLAVLTFLAMAGAIFGWHQARAAGAAARDAEHQRLDAVKNEETAKSEAVRAETNLSLALRELDRASLEEGKGWLERARTAKEKGDHFNAALLAGRAVGFRGYGVEKSILLKGMRYHSLLGLPLEHNPDAEEERQTEQKAAADLIDSLNPSFLPCWVRGHEGSVWSVAFSPDGTRVASGSDDKTVKLWNAATGKELATLTGHGDEVYSVAFSPDGTRLASGSRDKTVKLWDAATGKEITTFVGHSAWVSSVSFNPDGSRLASGSRDKTVKLWNTVTGVEIATLVGHSDSIESVAFSPDGTSLASGSGDKTVKLWDAATGKELATLAGHSFPVSSVAFNPNGTRLASGERDNTVKLWDTVTGKELTTLTGHKGWIESVAFSPDGMRLASGARDNTVKLWDPAVGKKLATLTGHSRPARGVAFSPDGTRLASASADGTVKLWNVSATNELATLVGHTFVAADLAFSPDSTRMASGGYDNSVRLWDTTTGKGLATLTGHSDWIVSIAFSADGTHLASGSADNTVKLWDAITGRTLATLTGHTHWVCSVTFSPDGTKLASGSADKTVKLWDAATHRELATFTGHEDSVWNVAFSPDGARLAAKSQDNTVKLWDVVTRSELKGKPDFSVLSESDAATSDGSKIAEVDGSVIRICRPSPAHPNLLHFEQQGLLYLEGKEFTWKKDVPLEKVNATTVVHYRDDPLAKLANPDLPPEESAVLRLQLCSRNWRAGLAVWRQLVQETPSLADAAPARRELLTLAAAMLQQLAHAEKPSAPAELCTAITENLRAEDFTDLRISLALAQAAKAVLADNGSKLAPLPVGVREAFRVHLLKTAPQPWREAVMEPKKDDAHE